ncbi:PREDICTED: mucin-12-like [Wasmannia auropunctata]|uniref:mucin-12-like n=1 Tax=Wasmannia auropunctata TaxID=64793 RepID=UPI0005EEB810|nr:PREDICTED: mucin-12-like [Wasmannia auropunctata]
MISITYSHHDKCGEIAIVRRCFTPTAVFIVLTLLGGFDGCAAERWSRQVSNSEWIPLANPGTASGQLSRGNAESGLLSSSTHLPNPIQTLALPPALQQQYQEQLIQLQKTQESIQKLLLLQQQLKTQQQLLQTQTFLPGDYSNAEDEKQVLPSSLGNLQTPPELTSEALVPPHPDTGALPPVRPPQNFLPQRPGQAYQELSNLPQGQVILPHGQSGGNAQEGPHAYITKQGSQKPDGKRLKGQSSLIGSVGDEEEEVQLVYVPVETLAQRGQPKRNRGRKQYPVRQQHPQRENQGGIDQTSLSPDQETFARQVLQQIQREHEETAQFLKEERVKEFAKLNEEQRALERKARLQQEALQREQELLRQKEAEKQRKELERLEEMARQRELDRIREAREKQRQEELERRRLSELRVKEERRREEEARLREEGQQEDQLRVTSPNIQNPQSQALVREQARRPQLTDGTRIKKIRGRQRPRVNQYQEQSNYREVTTTPSPNQPPLSVYMGSPTSRLDTVKVTDVLKLLKHAKTIAVLDTVGPNSPQVFVGPSNLDPPYGYAKFDLPYLSSIDHNRVERKVDKLPFFVAPLSFDPPAGYSKIPFPAPHIGSVVVNNLSETSSESSTPTNEQNPNPTPLIEPNSYSDADQSGSIATTASYDSSTTQNFSPESNSPKYDPAYSTPPSNSKFRFRQYYDNKPKHYYEQETKFTTQSPKIDTTASYRQEVVYSSTPSFQDRSVSPHDPSTKEQELAAQLALINHELVQQREPQKYTAEQYHRESYDANEVRAPVGPTQYNLPAELPPISPHLPGLVNSLLDKQEKLSVAPTPPPTTTTTTTPTTTTTRISSTTYRPRGRGRIVPTRARTTQAPGNRTERTRRPTYNRSKSRFTTTTEEYRESSYEPTKSKTPETTQKYNANTEHRRPVSRAQKYRNRDRANSQSASESQSDASPATYSAPSGPASDFHRKETPVSNYPDNYPTTPMQTENYPPSLRDVTVQHSTPLASNDYSRDQNYPQNRPQEVRYQHQDAIYDQSDGFQQSALEKAPVNGFNYQVVNENSPDQTISQRPKEYPRYQEEVNYNLPTTVDPRVTPGEEHRYSPIYDGNVAQTQADYNAGKIESTAIETDPNASPVFVPLQQNKQEDYELPIPSTEPLIEITTTSTTTPAPVIIRQRVRARLGGGRTHHDSAIQTRPRGPQDEYVRFSAVNNDSGRGAGNRNRDGLRTRARARPQSHGSQVQTEGNEYIKIHAAQQQKLVATTVPPTTTTTTMAAPTVEEDVDYGFIRPPNFRPMQPVHPADSRFQAPITYRPALSEVPQIQHILSNDETVVESSPSQILKNRSKYHQTLNRRPTTKIFATSTTSTTTEIVPVATTMPDDTVYTAKPKPDEPKSTRIRTRLRRPGKKRITTTTESGLDAHNELPLDENYPRITSQQLPVTASGQQPLYDDNFDVAPQFVPNQNRPAQFYEENSESYPPQEFVLNFGNLPEQVSQREEYDQTQLASIPPKKYSQSGSVNSDAGAHSSGDIYGAESQWSTKLSKTSFQPSFASNRVAGESKRGRGRTGSEQENENAPEIITAGPEMSSVTVLVSSDYQKHPNDADNMDTVMDGFGWKTNAQDSAEKLNATRAVTNSPNPITALQDQSQSDKETRDWMNSKNENFTEQMNDGAKVTKPDSPTGRKTRRRKVRVRVRPLTDDFVTAESQHYNSAVNSLVQDQYKYNPIHDSRFTTAQPIATTVTASTAAAAESTKKSLLQNFLEEMLKNDEVSIPTRVTAITTEVPDWTMSTPMTTPYVFSDNGEVTTMKENYTPIDTTLTSNVDEERVTTVNEDSNGSKDEAQVTSEGTTHLSQGETEVQKVSKSEEYKNSQEDKSEQNDLENVEVFNQRYNLPSNSPGSGIANKDEDSATKVTGFPKEDIRKLSAIGKEKEHIMTLKRQENVKEDQAHPKNHRAKWSEVRYPSALDKSNSYSTTAIPGAVTQDEGDGSVKTLSDYVKAIFDSMKNAEGEEVAKVVEAKSETDNYNSNGTASAHAANESEEIDRRTVPTGSPQDTSATQRVKVEENGTKPEETQEATTKESPTTFEAVTLIPDTTANTVVPSEGTPITEPSTTTTKTSLRQASNVFRTNSTMLGKVLRTSTTTKVSHMTEICYRGRCVMTRPKMEDAMTR